MQSQPRSSEQNAQTITPGNGDSKKRRVVIVGIPGVGKSTVVKKILEIMDSRNKRVKVVNYGTVMFEEASKLLGLKSRDDMRKLPVDAQRDLQVHAASHISQLDEENLIIDTHLFISTPEGYWPGMPLNVLEALKPTHLVFITAAAENILARRANDPTRARDNATSESLAQDIDAAKSLLFTSSIICGCPALIVKNDEGKALQASEGIIASVFNA